MRLEEEKVREMQKVKGCKTSKRLGKNESSEKQGQGIEKQPKKGEGEGEITVVKQQ